jgi:hypothetical protein
MPSGDATVHAGFVVVALFFGSFLVAGGVLSKPVVATAQADKGSAVLVWDAGIGEIWLWGRGKGGDECHVCCALSAAAAGGTVGRRGSGSREIAVPLCSPVLLGGMLHIGACYCCQLIGVGGCEAECGGEVLL